MNTLKQFIILICASLLSLNLLALIDYRSLAEIALSEASQRTKCISVAIVSTDGQLSYFERQDCAFLGSVKTSIQKAESANAFHRPTSDFVKALKDGKLGIIGANGVLALEGGVPITINGNFMGAIGIGGATSIEDEEIAKAALQKWDGKNNNSSKN